MKLSHLKNIIKEEIRNVLENEDDEMMKNLKSKIGFEEPTGPRKTKIVPARLSLKDLPGYNELPDERGEKLTNKMYLPSINNPGGKTGIFSKLEANEWVKSFVERYGEPEFEIEGKDIIVTNDSYSKAKENLAKAITKFGTQGD